MSTEDGKIVICGVGRSGTSFLVALFTMLGFDTGFEKEYVLDIIHNSKQHAGLEIIDFTECERHHIVKNPEFSLIIDELAKKWKIQYVLIPIRNMHDSANSRATIGKNADGGLWLAEDLESQLKVNLQIFGKLVSDIVLNNIPHIFIIFPRLSLDPVYCYNILSPILGNIDYKTFQVVHNSLSRPDYIHFK